MSLTVISTVSGVLGTVPKELECGLEEREIGGRIQTIHTTALLRSARIPIIHGNVTRLAITQSQMKDFKQTLVRKIHQIIIDFIKTIYITTQINNTH